VIRKEEEREGKIVRGARKKIRRARKKIRRARK